MSRQTTHDWPCAIAHVEKACLNCLFYDLQIYHMNVFFLLGGYVLVCEALDFTHSLKKKHKEMSFSLRIVST